MIQRAPGGAAARERTDGSFGEMLRGWRLRRRYTQLALALEAGSSSRHLSFLETGRAAPSREMVHRLSEHLEVPLRERNALLLAAGFAPAYPERPLEDDALAAAREAIGLVLAGFEPFPALAVDRHWTMVAANGALPLLLDGVAPWLLAPPVNALRVSLHPEGLAPRIANLAQWRAHVLGRLDREAARTADPALVGLAAELRAYPAPRGGPAPAAAGEDAPAVAVPLRLRTGRGVLSLVSATTVFGTAVDVALAEVAIECFLPADAPTRAALQAAAGEHAPSPSTPLPHGGP